jgi:molecular chaperone DnaK (HSP70)
MNEPSPVIGIDFGTTNSSAAWFDPRKGRVELLRNAEGHEKTPSLVYFGERETLVGEPTVQHLKELYELGGDEAREELGCIIKSVKRRLLSPPRILLPGGREVRPVDAAAAIIGKLKRDAEECHLHRAVERAVVTCPATFDALQRAKIAEAARLAGFKEVELLEEPVAAALAFAAEGQQVGEGVLVYDLGGGTFDLAFVVRDEDGSFHTALETDGDAACGGDDFDLALYEHCAKLARRELGCEPGTNGHTNLDFLEDCRQRKERLSSVERSSFSSLLAGRAFKHTVERATFEGLIRDRVERTVRQTAAMVKKAEAQGWKVDTVVLIGGSARIPLVERLLREVLPVAPRAWAQMDVAVAMGAAYHAQPRSKPSPPPAPPKPRATQKQELYRLAVEMAWADRKLEAAEAEKLRLLAEQLGLSAAAAAEIECTVMGKTREMLLNGSGWKPASKGEAEMLRQLNQLFGG